MASQFNFDLDATTSTTSLCIAFGIFLILLVLCFVFNYSALAVPSSNASFIRTSLTPSKQKSRASESKKAKKNKKPKRKPSSNDDTKLNQVKADGCSSGSANETDLSTPSTASSVEENSCSESVDVSMALPLSSAAPTTEQQEEVQVIKQRNVDVLADFSGDIDRVQPTATVSATNSPASTKRAKRRVAAKQRRAENQSDTSSPIPNRPMVCEALPVDNSVVYRLQAELDSHKCQLMDAESKSSSLARQNRTLDDELNNLKVSEAQVKRGRDVVQQQYTTLLAKNKSIANDCNAKQTKISQLEVQVSHLEQLLKQTDEVSSRGQDQSSAELQKLRDQLTVATLVNAAGPSPDVLQALTTENMHLKTHIDQLETNVNQLHQTNGLQRQELKSIRLENRKLHVDSQSAMEELRCIRQNSQPDASQRLAAYENQLLLQRQELELNSQRFQECAIELNEARCEVALAREREQQKTDMIASLKYQFQELNAEKQRLTTDLEQSSVNYSASLGQALAQLANANSDLAKVKAELEQSEQRLVEATRQSNTDEAVEPASSVSDSTSSEVVTTLEAKLDDALKVQRNLTLEAEHHKNTLLQTEAVLAKLQDYVEDEEAKWRGLLGDSERQNSDLTDQLNQAADKQKEISSQLEGCQRQISDKLTEMEALRSSICQMQSNTSAADQLNDNAPQLGSCEAPASSSSSELEVTEAPKNDMDNEFDAVLIDVQHSDEATEDHSLVEPLQSEPSDVVDVPPTNNSDIEEEEEEPINVNLD